jgi:hypothetical protein
MAVHISSVTTHSRHNALITTAYCTLSNAKFEVNFQYDSQDV